MKHFRMTQLICWLLLPFICSLPAFAEEPLTLKTVLSRALEQNPLVKEARLGVASGNESISSSYGKHFPKLSVDLSYTQRQDPFPYIPAQGANIPAHFSDSFASVGLVLTLPLYQGGQTVTGVNLSTLRRDQQQLNLALTRNELIANTVNSYNKLLQLQKLREASQATIKALETNVANARQLLQVGRIARVDLLKVEVQLANEEQRALSFDEAIATTSATLRYLMGEEMNESGIPLQLADSLKKPEMHPNGVVGGGHTRWTTRPEYQSSLLTVQESELSHRLTFGRLLPTVNALFGYQDQFGFSPRYSEAGWYVGLQVSVPLFERSLYADIRRDAILKEKSAARQQVVERQMRLELITAEASLKESAIRIMSAEKVLSQAHESFRIEQEKYRVGAGTMSDLLLAQAADMNAEANYSQALFDYNAALVAWHKANGTLEEYLK